MGHRYGYVPKHISISRIIGSEPSNKIKQDKTKSHIEIILNSPRASKKYLSAATKYSNLINSIYVFFCVLYHSTHPYKGFGGCLLSFFCLNLCLIRHISVLKLFILYGCVPIGIRISISIHIIHIHIHNLHVSPTIIVQPCWVLVRHCVHYRDFLVLGCTFRVLF